MPARQPLGRPRAGSRRAHLRLAQHPLLLPVAGRLDEQALRARAALASQHPYDLACLPG